MTLSVHAADGLEYARRIMRERRPDRPERPAKAIKSFYSGWPWKRVRYQVLRDRGRKCECCGASAADGAKIVVDHVKPVRHFWELRLDPKNLQILCDGCNRGKGSHDATDWREPPVPT